MKKILSIIFLNLLITACSQGPQKIESTEPPYFDNSGRSDVLTGGVRMIPVTTPKGTFKV